MPPKILYQAGQKLGKNNNIEYIKEIPNTYPREAVFKCHCGKIFITRIQSVTTGVTVSCKCKLGKTTKHGLSNDRLFTIYSDMRQRCLNKKEESYKYYGGRGIKISLEFDTFIKFYNWAINTGYDENLSIDRIDVNGNYEPSNCRWATIKEQANNRRSNHKITFFGISKNLNEWAKEANIPYNTIINRLKKEWPVSLALTIPPNELKSKKLINYLKSFKK